MLRALRRWLFEPSCTVYVACSMTGRDKLEMVRRATFVCDVLKAYGLTPISPVLAESVPAQQGKLVNHDAAKVQKFWATDKYFIRRPARVIWMDHGEMHSFGMTREYCLSRGVLWKPTVMYVPQGTPLSVAPYEDDLIGYSVHFLAAQIKKRWGSRWDYWMWRLQMLNRSLPGWLLDQLWAWN
jgi:hypothetical protein